MNKDLKIDFKSWLKVLGKAQHKFSSHFSFAITLVVLLAYIFVVWQIKQLVAAEPTDQAQSELLTSAKIPKIDQKAINQIQSLEQSSPQIHSLFNEARNNPFNE